MWVDNRRWTSLFTSQDVNWWTGVVWIIVMFLSAVWTLILTAPIHCRASIAETVMECFIFPNLMKKKLISIFDVQRIRISSANFGWAVSCGIWSWFTQTVVWIFVCLYSVSLHPDWPAECHSVWEKFKNEVRDSPLMFRESICVCFDF